MKPTGQRPVLSGVQLRRAIENAGGLWTAGELQDLGAMRIGDPRGELPAGIYINKVTYRGGYDMLAYAEKLERAASAEKMVEAIERRLAQTRKHYSESDNPRAYRKTGINHKEARR